MAILRRRNDHIICERDRLSILISLRYSGAISAKDADQVKKNPNLPNHEQLKQISQAILLGIKSGKLGLVAFDHMTAELFSMDERTTLSSPVRVPEVAYEPICASTYEIDVCDSSLYKHVSARAYDYLTDADR